MRITSSRWRLAAAASPLALAMSFAGATPALAQTTQPTEEEAAAPVEETTAEPT